MFHRYLGVRTDCLVYLSATHCCRRSRTVGSGGGLSACPPLGLCLHVLGSTPKVDLSVTSLDSGCGQDNLCTYVVRATGSVHV